MMMEHPGKETIRTLQVGRALAALSVVMMHTMLPTEHLIGPIPRQVTAILENGYLGVDFFFVLSGFIIFYTNHTAYQKPGWAARYLSSRLTRIYIPYLPVGIALGLLYTFYPGMGQAGQPWSWAATLALLPHVPQSALGVAWTLTYELTFYLLAFGFFRLGKPLLWASLWAAVIVLRHVLGPPFKPAPDMSVESVLLNPMNLEFVFGMYAAWIVINNQVRANWIFPALGGMFVAAFVAGGLDRPNSYIFGLGLACLIIPIIRAEVAQKIKVDGWALLLGNASYAIYLVHPPTLSISSRLVGATNALAHWQANILIGFAASAGIGVAYYLLYEKPMLRLVRPYLSARRKPENGRDHAHAEERAHNSSPLNRSLEMTDR